MRIGLTIAVLCLIWGTTWSVIQVGLESVPPFAGIAIRFAIASALLLGITFARGIKLGRTSRERGLWIVNGLFSFTIAYGVTYWSEQWVPSGLAAVLFATFPLFVAVLAHFIIPAESLTRREVIGIPVGFAGVGVIFSADFAALGGGQVALASVVMLLSPLAAAVGSVAVKRWGSDLHPLSLTAPPMVITAGLMAGIALALERDRVFVWNAESVGALLYLAVFGSAVTFTLYYWLLSRLPAKHLALIAYVVPMIALGVGALRGEQFTMRTMAGSALVVIGVALAVTRWSPRR